MHRFPAQKRPKLALNFESLAGLTLICLRHYLIYNYFQ